MAIVTPYHRALQEMLEEMPSKGHGHRWFFRVALHMRHYHSEDWTYRLLRACADNMDRLVPDRELTEAITNAFSKPQGKGSPASPGWFDVDEARIRWAKENTRPLFTPSDTAEVACPLDHLFSDEDLVCVGAFDHAPEVLAAQEAKRLDRQFVVPNPMSKEEGFNQSGKRSKRCLDNTGARRWLVVESDLLESDEQAVVLSHLARILPLRMVVHSGRESLHGWFRCEGLPERQVRLFMQYAVTLGADYHTFVRCQWVRFPGGSRLDQDGGFVARQRVVYLIREDGTR